MNAANLLVQRCNSTELLACAAPVQYLLTLALELLFKSAILHERGDLAALESIGHRMEAALREAESSGLPITVSVRAMAIDLAEMQSSRTYRYIPDVPEIHLWHPAHAISTLNELVPLVESFIGPDRLAWD